MQPKGPLGAEADVDEDRLETDVRSLRRRAPITEPRTLSAWRQWLSSMATDAEAALAAAIAYRDLDDEGRERWLDSLAADAPQLDVPRIALYAPLLSVETDPERRMRLLLELDEVETPLPSGRHVALQGRDSARRRVTVMVLPLYLDFVQVLACAHDREGFDWVRHDPIVDRRLAPQSGDAVQGVVVESTPLGPAIDELATAVLAHRRSGRELPDALTVLTELLEPTDHPLR